MNPSLDPLIPRPVCDSQSEMNEFVLPNDANPLGALLGGRLMHWIDMAGALAAQLREIAPRHHAEARRHVHVGSAAPKISGRRERRTSQ